MSSPADLLDSIFHALSHRARRRMLEAVCEEPGLTYRDLMEAAGIREKGVMNYHLKRLSGLIVKKDGRYYPSSLGLLAKLMMDRVEGTLSRLALAYGDHNVAVVLRSPTPIVLLCPLIVVLGSLPLCPWLLPLVPLLALWLLRAPRRVIVDRDAFVLESALGARTIPWARLEAVSVLRRAGGGALLRLHAKGGGRLCVRVKGIEDADLALVQYYALLRSIPVICE